MGWMGKFVAVGALAVGVLYPGSALSVGEASAQAASATVDPPRNEAFPARNAQLVILSHGSGMNALFFLAAGEGPKPTMVLLHGLPGNERNLDLAQAVRRAGWNVLTFTYRGAWGSEGVFSIEHALEDVGAAMDLLRTPEAIRRYGIDPRRIVVAGHSMGGLAALSHVARDPAVAGIVMLDAWDAGATAGQLRAGGPAAVQALVAELDDIGHSLGPVTAADLVDELVRRGENWNFSGFAAGLGARPLLTVYATHGGAAENRAFADRLRRRPGTRVTAVEINSDHSFADSRIRLANEVVQWLGTLPATR
jgi:pimeloyl-ACP methyl ester carboxylesterase